MASASWCTTDEESIKFILWHRSPRGAKRMKSRADDEPESDRGSGGTREGEAAACLPFRPPPPARRGDMPERDMPSGGGGGAEEE